MLVCKSYWVATVAVWRQSIIHGLIGDSVADGDSARTMDGRESGVPDVRAPQQRSPQCSIRTVSSPLQIPGFSLVSIRSSPFDDIGIGFLAILSLDLIFSLELQRDKHIEFLTNGLRQLGPSFCVLDAKYVSFFSGLVFSWGYVHCGAVTSVANVNPRPNLCIFRCPVRIRYWELGNSFSSWSRSWMWQCVLFEEWRWM